MRASVIALVLATLISGTFALQHGEPKTRAELSATPIRGSHLDERLDLWLTDPRGRTIRNYRIDMTKFVHLIVISDDFASFAHVHPTLGADGHFHIDHRFSRQGVYHVYSDAEPESIGQQVFRYDMTIGTASTQPRALGPSVTSVDVDGYRVRIGSSRLHPGVDTRIPVYVAKDGRPATDLHPYLGALAHAVFIDAKDLSYTHVHPMPLGAPVAGGMDMDDMPGMDMPALPDSARSASEMLLDVRVARSGTYKLWLQFRGGHSLHVATFVLSA